MTTPNNRAQSIVERVRNRSVSDRAAFLDGSCGEDAELRAEVERLLALEQQTLATEADAAGGEISTATATGPELANVIPLTEEAGSTIGRYRLLEKIGEGGFGAVWAAEQKEPVKRRVALKIIKLGMDTKQVVARFEAERQALALMDHPNIAKVLDAGATETGRPYFVMELVKGIQITKYCNQERLDTNARLGLFIKVCQAIQHAHQKGIIHRDIKPSNILVTLHDREPVPKVIDFGIAKATQHELTELTIYTQQQQFIGTPAYMSPEQAEMSGLDIDTRSDIYSLGVLLYELLAGRTPFDSSELIQRGLDAMRRMLREKEPPRPSTKVLTLEVAERTTTAGQRSSDTSRLINLLKGDLDWIVMRCLEKDRTRRYDTANGLAMDLHRHLNNETVVARPPSAAYRFHKAWRRNRLACTAALAVAAALILGFAFSAWQAAVATQAKNEAEVSQREAVAAEGRMHDALDLAEQERDGAIRSARELRGQVYVSDIGLAHRAVGDGDLGRARALIAKHLPSPTEPDLRGFEWRHLWSRAQGDFEADLGDYVGYLSGLTISPDGRLVALNRRNPARVEIIHLASGSVAKSLEMQDPVMPLIYSPGGSVLTGMIQGKLGGWDTGSWKALETLSLTTPFAFGYRGGQEILVAREGDHLSICDVTSWQTLGTLQNKEPEGRLIDPSYGLGWHMVNVMAVSSNLEVVYLAGAQKIRRWDLNQRTELPPFEIEGIACLATSRDGQLAGADAIGNVLLIQPESGEILHTFNSHTAWTTCLEFTTDGARLISANEDRNLVIYDTINRSIIGRLLGHQNGIAAVDISADGQTVVSGASRILRWSLAGIGAKPFDLNGIKESTLLEDGRILLLRESAEDLEYYDPVSGAVEPARAERLVHAMDESQVEPIAFSPTAKWALSLEGSKLAVWNVFTGELERSLAHPSGIIGGAIFSPDGKFLATDGETEVRLWKTRDWMSKSLGPNVASHLNWGAFSRDTRRVATAASDGSIHVFDFEQEPREIALEGDAGTFYSVALSNDGRWLSGGAASGEVYVWDLESKARTATLKGHLHGVFSLSFSPDDQTLVSASGSKVIFWHVETWQELVSVYDNVPPRAVYIPQVQFSPDGRYLARMGTPINETGTRFRIWRAPMFDEIEAME